MAALPNAGGPSAEDRPSIDPPIPSSRRLHKAPLRMGKLSRPLAIRSVGMDLEHPYRVYVNGMPVAEHSTEAAASDHYDALRRRLAPQKA